MGMLPALLVGCKPVTSIPNDQLVGKIYPASVMYDRSETTRLYDSIINAYVVGKMSDHMSIHMRTHMMVTLSKNIEGDVSTMWHDMGETYKMRASKITSIKPHGENCRKWTMDITDAYELKSHYSGIACLEKDHDTDTHIWINKA